jgi:hypothetical protein
MRARRADQERHAGEVADRRARRAGRRARCLGASRSARHGRVIICHGNIRIRAEVRAGELLREIAERKERHAGKACQGVARCYPYGSAQTLGPRGHRDALAGVGGAGPAAAGSRLPARQDPYRWTGDCRATLSAPANLKT